MDLVETQDKVQDWIRSVKPSVLIFQATHGRLLLNVLLGQRSQGSSVPLNSSPLSKNNDQLFETWSFEPSKPIHMRIFQQLLGHLPPTLFLAKDFMYASGKQHQLMLQVTGKRAVVSEHGPWGTKQPSTRIAILLAKIRVILIAYNKPLSPVNSTIDCTLHYLVHGRAYPTSSCSPVAIMLCLVDVS